LRLTNGSTNILFCQQQTGTISGVTIRGGGGGGNRPGSHHPGSDNLRKVEIFLRLNLEEHQEHQTISWKGEESGDGSL